MKDFFLSQGVFSWNELMTTDVESAKSFYGGLLGWEFVESPMQQGGSYVVAVAGDKQVGGIFLKPEGVPEDVPPHWSAYLTVDDVDEAAGKVKELGGVLIMPPTDIPKVGRFCVVLDPQGAHLSLISYSKEMKGGSES